MRERVRERERDRQTDRESERKTDRQRETEGGGGGSLKETLTNSLNDNNLWLHGFIFHPKANFI